MSIFFSADHHFGHSNIIRFCNRPFKNVGEMNQTMIIRWNSRISNGDVVYYLGDFAFGATGWVKHIREQLNGEMIFVRGGHDKSLIKAFGQIPFIREITMQTLDKQLIVLCHYSMRTWAKSHYDSWHLFGHSHGKLQGQGKSFDVGVDAWDFYPVSFEQVRNEMNSLPHNFNYVGEK